MDAWPPLRSARPVADAPRPAGAAVAKAWLLALMARIPLDDAARIPVADLALHAPDLGDALVAALHDDAALARLEPGGDLAGLAATAGALAGALDPAAVAGAVDALRTVTWGVLRSAMGAEPDPRLVTDLAERLSAVTAVITTAALSASAAPAAPLSPEAPPAPEAPAPWPAAGTVPLVVHDARTDREPWLRSLDFALARRARTGEPFTLVLVDLDEVERLVAAEAGAELTEAVERVERALRGQLRGEDALVRERVGRYWVIAAALERTAGRELAHRLAAAVSVGATLHGAPLTASVGLAVCPDDGLEAVALAGHADEGVFAARAAGIRLA